jgi:O-antigen/teichoic acid export membrane protein
LSQLKKGAILSYITILLTNVVGLLLTPFIIKSLGDAEYGLYTLIGAFVGYISVLDFGLNNTIVRFVAKYRAEKDKKGEENFLFITMCIYGVISIIVVLIGIIIYLNLETIFSNSLTLDELAKARVMYLILIFNLAITLPGGAFTGICSGYEHFVYPRTINILRYLVRSAMVVGLLLIGGDSIGLVVLDSIMNILVIVFNGVYVLKKLKVKFKLHCFEMPLIKEIFSYSVWIFVLALVSQLQWKLGQIVIGTLTNTTLVAIYAVGIMLGSYYGAFSSAITGVFLPRATKMTVENATGAELTLLMIKIGRLSFLVLMLVFSGFLLFGKQFVILWVGESYLDAWFVALIIMVGYTTTLVQGFANVILNARSLFKFKAFIYIVLLGFGTFCGAFMVKPYGIIGMVLGTTIGWVIAQIIMNIYFSKVIDLNIPLFFKKIFSKTIPSLFIIMIIGYFIENISGVGWLNLIIKLVLHFTVYILIMYFFGMLDSEKKMVKNALSFLKRN